MQRLADEDEEPEGAVIQGDFVQCAKGEEDGSCCPTTCYPVGRGPWAQSTRAARVSSMMQRGPVALAGWASDVTSDADSSSARAT